MKIKSLRGQVYRSYDNIIEGKRQLDINFSDFLIKDDLVSWFGNIEDELYFGKDFFVGNVVEEQWKEGRTGSWRCLISETDNGIEIFEHYSKRGFLPFLVIPENKGLIANKTELRKKFNCDGLGERGFGNRNLDELIKVNFNLFPILMDKLKSSSETEYQEFYLKLFSKYPLLY